MIIYDKLRIGEVIGVYSYEQGAVRTGAPYAGYYCLVDLLEVINPPIIMVPSAVSFNSGWTRGTGTLSPGGGLLQDNPFIPNDADTNIAKTIVPSARISYTLIAAHTVDTAVAPSRGIPIPAFYDGARTVAVTIRSKVDAIPPVGSTHLRAQLFKSDLTTPLSDAVDIPENMDWVNDTVLLHLTDDPVIDSLSIWSSARLTIISTDAPAVSSYISLVRVNVNYRWKPFIQAPQLLTGVQQAGTSLFRSHKRVIAYSRIGTAGGFVSLYRFPWGWEIISVTC